MTTTIPYRAESSSLANPQFRLLFLGNTATMLGFSMMQVAQGVLAFNLTGSNRAVGFVAMGWGIPMVLLGPVGGALSDRMSKRMLLTSGQAAVGAGFAIIGLLTMVGATTIWILAGVTLLMGLAFSMLMPARQAWLGDLLHGPALANGIALQQLSMNATGIVGPLGAGGMIAIAMVGVGGTYIVMSGFFLMAMALLVLMQPTEARSDSAHTSVMNDLERGLRYAWETPDVRLFTLMFGGVVLTGFSYPVLMPGFLEHDLGQAASWVGLMYGVAAVGGIVFTLLVNRGTIGIKPATLMFLCGAALAVGLVVLALSPTFLVALGVAAMVGAATSGFQLCNQVNLMQRTSAVYFGRVMSLTMTAFGLQLIVGFPAGALADQAGERLTLVVLAVACLAVVAASYFHWRSIPDVASGAWR
jgi:MFS family permease